MRAFNRLLSALLALAIAGAGLLIAAEVVVDRTGWATPPLIVPYFRWRSDLRQYTWNQTYVWLIAIGVLVVGLLLIIAAMLGRERRVRLTSDLPEVDMSTSPRSLERALRNEATKVDGVGSAKAHVRRRRARVKADVRLGEPAAVEQQLESTLSERLTQLSPVVPRKLAVRVKATREQQ